VSTIDAEVRMQSKAPVHYGRTLCPVKHHGEFAQKQPAGE
jgi:hypothetical protein